MLAALMDRAVEQDVAELRDALSHARTRRRRLRLAVLCVVVVSLAAVSVVFVAKLGTRSSEVEQQRVVITDETIAQDDPQGLPEAMPETGDVEAPAKPIATATEHHPSPTSGISSELVGAVAGSVVTLLGAMGVGVQQRRRDDRVDEACIEIARCLSTGPKLFAELLAAVGDERVLNRALARLTGLNRVLVNQGVSWEWRT
jgi:hypothetical protein